MRRLTVLFLRELFETVPKDAHHVCPYLRRTRRHNCGNFYSSDIPHKLLYQLFEDRR